MSDRDQSTKTGGRPATKGVIRGDVALAVGNPETPCPPGWKWTALSDVARLETGHTPSRKHPEYWGGQIPWIGIKDATGNHGFTIYDTVQHTNELGINNSSARVLPTNTVCLSRTASVGYVVVMGKPMATSQDFVNWVCGERLDYRYLKYVLLAEMPALRRFSYGTTHQTIYFPEVKAFHVCLPPIDEQRRIADLLQALDDKFELNRQMCATLEEMARAIFRSWFVDFDPVREKVAAIAEGRDPEQAAMAAISGKSESELDDLPAEALTSLRAIAARFPHEFEDSDLGSTPSGWTVERLDGWLDVLETGSRPKGGVGSITEGVPSVGAESVLGLGRFDFDKTKYVSADFAARMNRGKVADFDVLLYKDGGKPGVFKPRVTMFGLGFPFPEFVINEHVFRLRSVALGQSFLHFLVSDPRILSDLAERGGKAAIPGINQGDVKSQNFCVPPQELREEYASLADPLIRRALIAAAESRKLASVRDALLPKLLSGELRWLEGEEELSLDQKLLELAPWYKSVIGWLQDPGAVFREMFADAEAILRRDPATDLDYAEGTVADLLSEDHDGMYSNIEGEGRFEYIAADLAQFIGKWRSEAQQAGLLGEPSEATGA